MKVEKMPTELEIYLFDLQGYVQIDNALTIEEVEELNYSLDKIPSLEPGEWYGYVQAHSYGGTTGPSPELLERLTPERRQIVQPQPLLSRQPRVHV